MISITGNAYYRLTGAGSNARGYVDSGYPRSSSVWNIQSAIPCVDAALQWDRNGRTYMFCGDKYIRLVDYPLSVGETIYYILCIKNVP